MKTINNPFHRFALQATRYASVITLLVGGLYAGRAQDIWTGTGVDAKWQTPGNWQGGNPPAAGDQLIFTGVTGLNNTNDFLAGTTFGGLYFKASAGAFALNGNRLTLNGNITNSQVVTEQSINLPMVLGTTPLLDIVPNGRLTINGVLSGSGGLILTDDGQLNLNGVNTFTGPVTINAGEAVVNADSAFGAAPGAATPNSIIISVGALRAASSFTLNASRGIGVGGTTGDSGVLTVDAGKTLSYGGVIADHGAPGGLVKNGFGTLSLSGANAYTGATSNRVGTLALDFTQSGSPVSNIISPGSDLTLGGENAGFGAENFAELSMQGKNGAVNSQSFHSTHLTFAGSVVQAGSGTGGTANLNLGSLSHDFGGTLLFLSPDVSGGNGHITTTSPNVSGILGGWATIGDGTAYSANGNSVLYGTNYATVDASGNIVNFTNYLNYASGNLNGQVSVDDDLLFAPLGPSVITVDNASAGTTTTVNAIKIIPPDSGSTANYYGIYIGQGNTLRLGQFGGIMKEDRSQDVITIGGVDGSVQTGSGVAGAANIGAITAGGADNTPGEIVMTANAADESHGTTIFEAKITDNGSGKVAFVKTGPGSIKLDGHNTFSGGLYLLQGRVQFAGHELDSSGASDNPDAGGTGPIYILPGSYLFPSGIGSGVITNDIYVAGNGTAAEPLGAMRGGNYGSTIHLIGDATFGAGTFMGPILGSFNLGLCMPVTTHGDVHLASQGNDWTGDTFMNAEDHSGNNYEHVYNETNEVIPNGFGKGNVTMRPGGGRSTSYIIWDLNGYSETINGLSTTGNHVEDCIITNSAASGINSVLTLGDNDQSGTFAGLIQDGGSASGTLGLTKIGAGVETLTGNNTYSGDTTVSGGTLALSGGTSISTSPNALVQNGGVLDVTKLTDNFDYPNNLSLNNDGTLLLDQPATIGNLNMADGRLRLDSIDANATVGSLSVSGSTNLIDIVSVGLITGYPAQFTVIKYSGSLNGTFNFGLGNLPSSSTTGYVSNNVANGSIDVVLLSGPEPLTWTGANGSDWDVDATVNWLAFGTTPSVYHQVDAVTFNDTASTGNVNLTTAFNPGFMEVNNSSLNYTFTGSGGIGGFGSLTKTGTGTLLLDNTGANAFSGGTLISDGVVQVGNNDAGGSLPAAGGVENDASLVFDRSDNFAVAGVLSGSGTITQNNTNTLTLSGNNAFTGPLNVSLGTVKAGSGTALGTTDGTTTISSGATLDVNGQTLNTEPVIVSGTGAGGQGAIVNSGADSLNAMGSVTLTGDTTFGGTGRWDIRGGAATLSTSGAAYNLTKLGTNQISLVGVNVDGGLGDINVMNGILSIETTTSGLGNAGNTLTISSGATLQIYNSTVALEKLFVLNGNGTATTLNIGAGTGNNIIGQMTLNGACIFSAATGSALTLSGTLTGNGSLIKTGAGTNIIASGVTANYSGGTTVSNGVLVVNGSLSGAVTVASGAFLGGNGTAGGAVTIQNGSLLPGDLTTATPGTMNLGSLTMNEGAAAFHLSSSPDSGNDQVAVSGGLTLSGTSTLQILPQAFMNVGDVYTLFTYGGSTLASTATNNLQVTAPAGFAFSIVDPATTPGSIKIHVDQAIGNEIWTGQSTAIWNTSSINWNRNANNVAFNNGDYVSFDDSTTVTNITLSGILQVGSVTMNNAGEAYRFGGSGSLADGGELTLTSGGSLVIANTGSNSFTGPITINAGILQLGDGGIGGNLGSGVVTNNGSLIFDHSDTNLVLNNVITGYGGIMNNGTGVVTLGGANTFGGEADILQGTLRANTTTALGDIYGQTVVSSGATLDIANVANLSKEVISVSGSGVGGNGAIVNNSGSATFTGPNLGTVYMNGDLTIGGSGRLDLRASSATAQDAVLLAGAPYTLTKKGTNLLQVAGVQIDPSIGNIDVQAGILGFQWQTPYLGDPSYNLTVAGGASLAFYDLSNSVSKVLILADGANVLGQHGDGNVFTGPATLMGMATFNVSGGTLTFDDKIGGAGTLVKTGGSTLILSTGPESYAGDTYVNGGVLALMDGVELTNSPSIVLSNATIDVSGRSDVTLALGSVMNQKLLGGGTINGILMENAGSVINPGNGVTTATLTVTNAATLSGNVVMDLNRTNPQTADEVVSPVITVAGPLTVTNLGPDLQTGDRFQLFSTAVTGFSSVNLPAHNTANTVTYQWENDLATDGSIKVLSGAGGVNTDPATANFQATAVSGSLQFSWAPDHQGWQLYTNAVGLNATDSWFPVPGSAAVTNETIAIDPSIPNVFFQLRYP